MITNVLSSKEYAARTKKTRKTTTRNYIVTLLDVNTNQNHKSIQRGLDQLYQEVPNAHCQQTSRRQLQNNKRKPGFP